MSHSTGGLEERYIVVKKDNRPVDPAARYIVLNYNGTDPHAVAALRAYADSVEPENPALASDIRSAISDPTNGIRQHLG